MKNVFRIDFSKGDDVLKVRHLLRKLDEKEPERNTNTNILQSLCVFTIGDLANRTPETLGRSHRYSVSGY